MEYLLFLPALIVSLTVHEAAHAITSYWLGDHLAKSQKRVSLNPMRHLSLWGTLALFVIGFGWGKPVPVNLYNFKNPKRDYLISSLAGPVSNVILAALILGIMHLPIPDLIKLILLPAFVINGVLAVFNLIPIPPLDGSKIWPCLIPGMLPTLGDKMSRYGMIILIISLYTGAISKITRPTVQWLVQTAEATMRNTEVYAERPEEFPTALQVPNDVNNVIYHVYPAEEPFSPSYSLGYVLKRPHPCNDLIDSISSHLDSAGWQKTKYCLYDPNTPSTNDWTLSEDDDLQRHQWCGHWIDHQDRWISLNLDTYVHPNDPNNMAWTLVDMSLNNMGSEESDIYSEYKSLHPDEFNITEPNSP